MFAKLEIINPFKLLRVIRVKLMLLAALEEKLKEVTVEQDEMKKCMGLMMKEIKRLSRLVSDNSTLSLHLLLV
nr:hypothetical protein [Tanacetum cinerariifolium]